MTTEEYVPINVPNISAKANHRILSGPKKNTDTRTNTTVTEVNRDRRIVPHIDLSMIFENGSFENFLS